MKNAGRILGLTLLLSFGVGGCAQGVGERRAAKQDLLEARPAELFLETPFIVQPHQHCGPASLAMALQFKDPEISFRDVSQMSFTPGAQGAFQNDMLSAARRLGYAPYAVRSFEDFLTALQTGEPIVVFQNLGFRNLPVWHYALAVGYDAQSERIFLHTGDKKAAPERLATFLKSWERGGRWSYIITRPDQPPDFAHIDEALENAEVFSRLGMRGEAVAVYRAALRRWPARYETDAGMALEFAAAGNYHDAIAALKEAIAKNPQHAGLYFNLAFMYRQNAQERLFEETKRLSLQKVSAEDRDEMLRRYADF